MADEDVILMSVSTIIAVAAATETSPTQSVMLGARLDTAHATLWHMQRCCPSSLIFMKFRLCRPSVHTGDKVEFDSLSRSTVDLSPKLNLFN